MQGTLAVDGVVTGATVDAVNRAVAAGTPYWLDLDGLDAEATLADISKAKRLLGWEPRIDFAQGVKDMMELSMPRKAKFCS